MAFIGMGKTFEQQYFQKTGDLISDPVSLNLIRSGIKAFHTFSPLKVQNLIFQQVIHDVVYGAFNLNHQRMCPIHLNDIPSKTINIDDDDAYSSPGLPWRSLGYETKKSVMEDPVAWRSVRYFWHRIKKGEEIDPPDSAAFFLSHNEEVEVCFVYPATISFQEACFALPLINAFKQKSHIVFDYEAADVACMKLHKRFKTSKNFLSCEFKSLDKTVPEWLIDIAFDIICLNIDFTHYQDYGVPDASKLIKVWDYIQKYFIRTPIRMCNGERYRKSKGVASGSYFTPLIISIVNRIVTMYAIRASANIVKDILVMGTQSLVVTRYPVDLDSFLYHASTCGIIVNSEKTKVLKSITGFKFSRTS